MGAAGFLFFLLLTAAYATDGRAAAGPEPAEILVRLKPGVVLPVAGERSFAPDVLIARTYPFLSARRNRIHLLLRAPNLAQSRLLETLRADPRVESAAPNHRRRLDETVPDDPSFSSLWGLKNTARPDCDIDATLAWDRTVGSPQVVVAVLDTGVDYTHPDLAANMWINPDETAGDGIDNDGNGYVDDVHGFDFAGDAAGNDDADPMDTHSHGTHVAGTIAAVGNNGVGVAGVSWNTKIMALKAARPNNYLYDADIVQALEYAAMMKTEFGVNIAAVNMSAGAQGSSEIMEDAIRLANEAGIVFCTSAGNDALDTDLLPHYPSSFGLPGLVSIAASDSSDNPASFTNRGAFSVDLAAPGVNIYSTVLYGSYGTKSGTSMAAPHVAGVVALLAAEYPGDTMERRLARLFSGTDARDAWLGKCQTGGRLNAARSLDPGLVLSPFVAEVRPETAVAYPGTLLRITGAEFGGAGSVVLSSDGGDSALEISSWTETGIEGTVPDTAFTSLRVRRADGAISNRREIPAPLVLQAHFEEDGAVAYSPAQNRLAGVLFPVAPDAFPLEIRSVQIYHNRPAGDDLDIVIAGNRDGDGIPGTLPVLATERHRTTESYSFNTFQLRSPVRCEGPGDVMIGYRDVSIWPAPALVSTVTPSLRSFVGRYATDTTVEWTPLAEYGVAGDFGIQAVGRTVLVRGDVNADRQVDVADVVAMLRRLVGLWPDPVWLTLADMDDSGGLDIGDLILIALAAAGV